MTSILLIFSLGIALVHAYTTSIYTRQAPVQGWSSRIATIPSFSTLFSTIGESSASKFSGAGPALVDMNQYNIPNLEDIASEWNAVFIPATPMQEEGVYLQSKTKDVYFADTIKFKFDRIANKRLGLQLLELAGGREDGLGITIIESVLEDGCAENSGLLPGDSIIKIDLIKTSKTNNVVSNNNLLDVAESEEIISIGTECFGYDRTVDAILSLPPIDDEKYLESFVMTVKRLRRKPKVIVKLQYPPNESNNNDNNDVTLELFAGENLRRALLVRGVKLNDPLAKRFDSGGGGDCGAEGTCATCAVSVVRGKELLNPPGSTESQIFNSQRTSRWRMSCKTIVGYGMKEGEIVVRVNPKQWDDGL